MKHPKLGEIRIVNQAVTLSRTPATHGERAARSSGEHTDEVLAELGYAAAEIEELRKKKVV